MQSIGAAGKRQQMAVRRGGREGLLDEGRHDSICRRIELDRALSAVNKKNCREAMIIFNYRPEVR
jgi:hypothetical protein